MSDYDKINYWVEMSDYDLETAKAMLKTKRYLYVGFMCHQAVEKILKALYVKKINDMPPYIHALKKMSELCDIYNLFTENQIDLLAILQPLNIEGRYPVYKEQIVKTLDELKCKELIKNTEEMVLWIKTKL